MKISKASILLSGLFLIVASSVNADELKPMASSFDITGNAIEITGQDKLNVVSVEASNNGNSKNKLNEDKKVKKVDKKAEKEKLKAEKEEQNRLQRENKAKQKEDKKALAKAKKEKKNKKNDNKIDVQSEIGLQPDADNNQIVEPENQQVEEVVEMKNATLKEEVDEGEEQLESVIPTFDPTTKKKVKAHDSDIKKQAEVVELELRGEEKQALRDLRVLWSAAVEKSTTIRLAIQKLSNPDESEKVKQSALTKFLSPLASLAPMAMMASSSATQTAGALVGGSMLGTLSSDVDNNYNRAFLHVSDFDLIMLARSVDELQSRLVVTYYEYVHSIERLEEAEKALVNAEKLNKQVKGSDNFAATTASSAFYGEAKQNHLNAKHNFLSARTALEQLTGNNAIVYIETNTDLDEETKPEDKKSPEEKQELGSNKVK